MEQVTISTVHSLVMLRKRFQLSFLDAKPTVTYSVAFYVLDELSPPAPHTPIARHGFAK